MSEPALKLFMVLLGCKPEGRFTEQHDVFFGVAASLKDLVPGLVNFWPEAKGKLHVDAWREIQQVNGYDVTITPRVKYTPVPGEARLFFINLGGYKKNDFEEFHYKMIVAAPGKGEAILLSKQTAFYQHTGFKGATSHVDDKYGIDVDDFFELADILDDQYKNQYSIMLTPAAREKNDTIHLGYLKLDKL